MRARLLLSSSSAASLFAKSSRSITDRFARTNCHGDSFFRRLAENGLGLILAFAIGNTPNVFAAYEIAEPVYFRKDDLIGIDVDADRTQPLVTNPFHGRGRAETNTRHPLSS